MSGTSWETGEVETKPYKGGEHRVLWFINNGIVWYDVSAGVCKEGWEKELEPYEGDGILGWPLDECPDWIVKEQE